MKTLMAAAVVLLTCGTAFAGWTDRIQMPAGRFLERATEMYRTKAGPGFLLVSQRELQRKCKTRDTLLGCHVDFHGMKVVYILDGMPADATRKAIIHEYAHTLGWRHD